MIFASRSAASHSMWPWAPLAIVCHAQLHKEAAAVGVLALLLTY